MRKYKFSNSIKFYNQEIGSLPNRKEIEEKYKWDLSDIYKTDEDWETDFKWVKEKIPEYDKFIGTLAKDANSLYRCLKFDEEVGIKIERLHLYAMLNYDGDMNITKYQAMDDRINNLFTQVSTAGSFIRPELMKMPDEKLLDMINSKPELKIYKHFVKNLLRSKAHTLDEKQEMILSLSGETVQASYNTFSIFTNADLQFPNLKDEDGKEINMSHGRYYASMYSKNRNFRERAFNAYYEPYKNYKNTFSSLLNGNIKSNIFTAKSRNYKSVRECSLDVNNIPLSVYDNLIKTANENLTPLHKWASLKKRLLNVKELKPYDVYVSLFSENKTTTYSYEESQEIILEALKPLGEDYINSLMKAFKGRWLDVFETKYKRNGAYSSGTTFGVHPYVLLNWTSLLNDVFTLAHELGHNMHSYYTGLNQPYPYANYSIFVAEVASTFNESLLLNYLIKKSTNQKEKLFLLEKYLNNITSTFYRQTMFAEYEMKIYDLAENGEALTADNLSQNYYNLYKKYWGSEMVLGENKKYTWARIPHFYYNYYVFQYATGFSASETLSEKVLNEGKPAVDKYLKFLKSGSSDYPINLLKSAGVDMNTPSPIIATTNKMAQIIDEIEKLIDS
ncbi:MAG: oligoendopeptidase F [Ignavibacteriales bacterium CG_4_9_14_3_um_filter_30_11]|nr:MAG: oligoendopeptidase F [Ignavibacteriales bacterium CG_4_9_14_3_um_filter_30_11]